VHVTPARSHVRTFALTPFPVHILLTDLLACPRCGPEHGLVLLADRVEERRVIEGRLGCPNCREQYRIHAGVADLRSAAESGHAERGASGEGAPPDPDEAMRLGALLGLAEAAGTVLLAGQCSRHAPALASLLEQLEVVAYGAAEPVGGAATRVTRMRGGARLPFRDGVLRGVALSAAAAPPAEALRVVQPGGRVVLLGASAEDARGLEAAGGQLLLEQDGVVVARASGQPEQLRLNALR
jgi:uncharacterized protein YbaR (Trm112 family)